jgi:hypothetical protein
MKTRLILAIAIIVFAYALYSVKTEKNSLGYIPVHISNSTLEWLDNKLKASGGVVRSLQVEEVIEGEVIRAGYMRGKIGGLKYYYTGSPGYYEYASYILIKYNGKSVPVYFSERRTQMMVVKAGSSPNSLQSIQPGDHVKIAEVIDLTKNNINDENLVSLTINVTKKN